MLKEQLNYRSANLSGYLRASSPKVLSTKVFENSTQSISVRYKLKLPVAPPNLAEKGIVFIRNICFSKRQ